MFMFIYLFIHSPQQSTIKIIVLPIWLTNPSTKKITINKKYPINKYHQKRAQTNEFLTQIHN